MMSVHYVWPAHTAAAAVSRKLAQACRWLSSAQLVAEHLVATDPRYRGTVGWDLQIAIDDAAGHARDAVRVHDLAKFDPFWSRRATHEANAAGGPVSLDTLQPSAGVAACLLVDNLSNAFECLTTAATNAETLVRHRDEHDSHYGAIGWDLETAIDDSIIALRDALQSRRLTQRAGASDDDLRAWPARPTPYGT